MIVADGNLVIVHGRFSRFGAPVNWIAADIVRIENGVLIEHWDVIQDEATQAQSKSGRPMFGGGATAFAPAAEFGSSPAAVPEPSTFVLAAFAGIGLLVAARRRTVCCK